MGAFFGAVLEGREAHLERSPRGIVRTRVFEAGVIARASLGEGAREHDGRHHGPVHRVRRLAGMNGERVEVEVEGGVGGHGEGPTRSRRGPAIG